MPAPSSLLLVVSLVVVVVSFFVVVVSSLVLLLAVSLVLLVSLPSSSSSSFSLYSPPPSPPCRHCIPDPPAPWRVVPCCRYILLIGMSFLVVVTFLLLGVSFLAPPSRRFSPSRRVASSFFVVVSPSPSSSCHFPSSSWVRRLAHAVDGPHSLGSRGWGGVVCAGVDLDTSGSVVVESLSRLPNLSRRRRTRLFVVESVPSSSYPSLSRRIRLFVVESVALRVRVGLFRKWEGR
jgi:hypothetical protein